MKYVQHLNQKVNCVQVNVLPFSHKMKQHIYQNEFVAVTSNVVDLQTDEYNETNMVSSDSIQSF